MSGANPIAEGAGRIGQGMVALSNEQRERDDALQAAEADAHLTTGLTDLRRRFETDSDWRTYEPRFQAEAARIRGEAASRITSPGLLRRWSPRADVTVSGAMDTVLGRQGRLRGEEEYDRLESTLGGLTSSYVTAADDDARAGIMRNIEDTIELGRRTGIVSADRLRELRRRHLHGAFEADADARLLSGDGYAALLEMREGDARATAPSAGEVSELGLSRIQRLLRPSGQTPQQAQADLRRLRTESARISQWVGANVVGPDGQPIALTQLQHDALVGFALSRRGGPGAKPEDALAELVPSIQTGNWESVASAIRAGSLTALEQPAPRTAPGQQRVNLDAANAALTLTPEERALYELHLGNLYGQGGIDQPGGARSTVLITRVEIDGRTYLMPTVFGGRQLRPGTPEFRAAIEAAGGPGAFPSYATDDEAKTRYDRLHEYFERDTQEYQRRPRTGQAPPSGQGAVTGLGSVSARYESGGRGVGFISSGEGDPGGPSYGIHQLSGASSMGAFLASPEGAPYRGAFGSAQPMTSQFNSIYRRLAERDPEGFGAAQRAFYTRTHYEPARTAAETAGFDVSSRAIQEALFSIGVQHGGARIIIGRAAEQMGPNASVEDQIRALYEARRNYHGVTSLPPQTRAGVLSRYEREVQDVLALARSGATGVPGAPAPQADPRNEEFGDMVIGQAPSSRYAGMPLDRRRALIGRLSDHLRVEAASAIDRDIESIRQTGEPSRMPDGSVSPWIGRIPTIFAGRANAQAARLAQRVAEARAQFQAIYGVTDMTPAEMGERLDQVDSVGDAEDGTTPRTRRFVAGVMRRVQELRTRDPALWASGTYVVGEGSSQRVGESGQVHTVPAQDDLRTQPAREVTQAYQLLARRYPHLQIQIGADGEVTYQPEPGALGAGQSQPQRLLLTDQRLTPADRQLIIEARLAAMARVGIPEGDRYVLRGDEAARILSLPADLTRLSSTEFGRHLRAATDRATELFGPRYARAAFNAALHFRRLSGQNLLDAQGESRTLGNRLAVLDREEALWSTGAPPVGFGSPFEQPMPGGATFFGGSRPSDFTISPDQALPGALPTGMPSWAPDSVGAMSGIPGYGPVSGSPAPAPGTLPAGPPLPVSPQPRATGVPGVSQQAWPRPTPEMISRLARLPAMQEEFDRTFGPGTAAHYLSLMQQGR